MKITGIETIPVNVPIHPERVTVGGRGTHSESPFLILQVHTDEGISGLGEVSCTPLWSGEDQVSATQFIRTILEPQLEGHDPLCRTHLATLMATVLANNPFTRAGVEMALWDIAGKAVGLPVYQLLGGAVRDTIRTKYSVSGVEPLKAAALATWAMEQGFTAMKVKVGIHPEADLERVRAVRKAVGPEVLLGVDANGGWDPSTAVQMVQRLEPLDIAFIEQPVPPGDMRWMARVRGVAKVPVIADESISTTQDALSMIAHDGADVFSVYVGMGGGIGEAAAVSTVAHAARLQCTVGSNLELGIAQAAMIHLAIALPAMRSESIPCDIISPFYYEGDILAEPLPIEAGSAHRVDRAGLGVELNMDAIERYRVL